MGLPAPKTPWLSLAPTMGARHNKEKDLMGNSSTNDQRAATVASS